MGNKVSGGTGRRASLNKELTTKDAPKTAGTTARRTSVTKSADKAKPATFDSAKGMTARREEISKRLTGERNEPLPAGSTGRRASIWKEIKED